MSDRSWTVDAIVGRMKAEITRDTRTGVMPRDVDSFSRLHDYVDANEYGGLCDPDCPFDAGRDGDAATINEAQTRVDRWLIAGRTDPDIVVEVVGLLRDRGHRVTYEYPGFVLLADNDGMTWYATGTVNETWTIDRQNGDASKVDGLGDTYILTSCPDAAVIVDAVERVLSAAGTSTRR